MLTTFLDTPPPFVNRLLRFLPNPCMKNIVFLTKFGCLCFDRLVLENVVSGFRKPDSIEKYSAFENVGPAPKFGPFWLALWARFMGQF